MRKILLGHVLALFMCVSVCVAPQGLVPALAAKVEKAQPKASAPAAASSIESEVAEAAAAYARGDYDKARRLWTGQAEKNDARAMNNLGVLYDQGQGVAQDAVQAAQWFRKAAEGGHASGMSNYGRMLEQGRGTDMDVDQALGWFRKAADLGQNDARFNLGVLYERGQGVPKSDKDAAAWYSMAAAEGQIDAQARLGQLYRDGRGVGKNATRAVLLLYGAAMDGHVEATRDLEGMAEAAYKGKAMPRVSVFGVELGGDKGANRSALRAALVTASVPAVREDNAYICDVYNVRKAVPGATEMAACYGAGLDQPLGFIKIDYTATDKKQAAAVQQMVVGRFGAPSAEEGGKSGQGNLWNLGTVVVATQYVPAVRQVGLMYMVPRVYHLTRQHGDMEEKGTDTGKKKPSK